MVLRETLLSHLDQLLKPWLVRDYCPNGLQVEGRDEINHIVTGVTASMALIEAAIECQADAIFVHHGYFWKGESEAIKGMKKRRLKQLLDYDISLFAYHLPLDVHPELGNNAQLAAMLDITLERGLELGNPSSVPVMGRLNTPMSATAFADKIERMLGRTPLVSAVNDKVIETIGMCTGGGQSFIELAADQGLDAFISGEASEQTIHTSREMQVNFFAAGHHATERYGAKAVGEHLQQQFDVKVSFIDIDNPV